MAYMTKLEHLTMIIKESYTVECINPECVMVVFYGTVGCDCPLCGWESVEVEE